MRYTFRYTFLVLLLTSAFSCSKEQEVLSEFHGQEICFSPELQEIPETKVSVSNWNNYGATRPMNWSNNDKISIIKVTESGMEDSPYTRVSSAWDSDNPLSWGAGPHDFFGIYPSDGEISIDNIDTEATPISARVTARIPSKPIQGDTKRFFVVAGKHLDNPVGAAVNIPFKPFFTILRFAFFNWTQTTDGYNKTVKLEYLKIRADKSLTGYYSAQVDSDGTIHFQDIDNDIVTSDGSTEISYNSNADGKTLPNSSSSSGNGSYATVPVVPNHYKWVEYEFSFTVAGTTQQPVVVRLDAESSGGFVPGTIHVINTHYPYYPY